MSTTQSAYRTLAPALDRLLARAVQRQVAPGFVAAVTDADATLYEGAAGQLAIDRTDQVTVDTLFRAASMTKAITTVGALQLIEAGRLGLDQEVASILPEFAELPVLEGFDGDAPRLRPQASAATVRHLLTHTSGHGYWWANRELARYRERTQMPDVLSGRLEALRVPLVADPGSRWEYGISTDWLGRVIEAVTGLDLAAYLRAQILSPLQMFDTTFVPTDENRGRLMQLHDRAPDGSLKLSELRFPDSPEFYAGGHGLYTTARDYSRFLRALLRDGELDGARILAAETVELAFSDQLPGLTLPEFVPSQEPARINDVVALPFRQSWGFGFQLMCEDIPGMRREGTGFWSGIFNTYFWIDRRSGLAATIMTQVLPLFDAAILDTVGAFESTLYTEAGMSRSVP